MAETRVEKRRSFGLYIRSTFVLKLLVLFSGVVVVVTLCMPTLLWFYHVEQAGRFMDRGLVWPNDQTIDQLPLVSDEASLSTATDHLQAALAWHPQDASAYRMLARIYAARHTWGAAADAIVQARQLSPRNPLVQWETALINEQLWRTIAAAPQTPLLPLVAAATIDTPNQRIDTPFCQPEQPQRCYVAQTSVIQPLAAVPDSAYTANAIFIHPPASVSITRSLSATSNALTFLLGLHPDAQDWNTDGVTYQIFLQANDGTEQAIYERSLDAQTLALGWTSDWVDLSRWSGQSVTLRFSTAAGPQGDTTGDWALWGDLSLTTRADAPNLVRYPRLQAQQAFANVGYPEDHFVAWDSIKPTVEATANLYTGYAWISTNAQQISSNVTQKILVDSIINNPAWRAAGAPTMILSSTTTLIEGETFRWNQSPGGLFATPLAAVAWDNTVAGAMWWGGDAIAVVDVLQPGVYTVTVRLASTPQTVADVQIEYDLYPIARFNTSSNGDWSTYEIVTELGAGKHILGIGFLNDGVENQADRNVFINWLEIQGQ